MAIGAAAWLALLVIGAEAGNQSGAGDEVSRRDSKVRGYTEQLGPAIRSAATAEVVAALHAGADPNARFSFKDGAVAVQPAVSGVGEPALNVAVKSGSPQAHKCIVAALLSAGASPDAVGLRHMPCLEEAATLGDAGAVALLVACGANVNLRSDEGIAPLEAAAGSLEGDEPGIVQTLLLAGARADAQDAGGRTALMAAAERGHVRSLVALVRAGADPRRADAAGRTAVAFARAWPNVRTRRDMVRALQHAARSHGRAGAGGGN